MFCTVSQVLFFKQPYSLVPFISMDPNNLSQADRIILFGPFRLVPSERAIFVGAEKVNLGDRAFDILVTLVSRPTEVISHREFSELVWPNISVEGVNLRGQIAALRKVLGSYSSDLRLIKSVPGRGYCFVGEVSYEESSADASPLSNDINESASNGDDDFGGITGRRADILSIVKLLETNRHVTIVGPGGVGKTTAALVAIRTLCAKSGIDASSVDLSTITEPTLIPTTIASALGIMAVYESPLEAVVKALSGKRKILFIDSCESVAESIAVVVETLLRTASGLTILTTSREPLRTSREWIYRLRPLPVPDRSAINDPDEATRWPSVKLFSERAAACHSEFQLETENVSDICQICIALDGLPLAIEMAASRIQSFGAKGLRDNLHHRFEILSQGKRTASPRHQTLRAMIDWSYETLTELEKATLRRIAIFKSQFSMAQAVAVLGENLVDFGETEGRLASLVDKSLLMSDVNGSTVVFYLLNSTRAYLIEELWVNGEYHHLARMHAEFVCSVYTEPETYVAESSRLSPLAYEPRMIDEVRSALAWSMREQGDFQLGIRLTWSSAPLFYTLSLFDEYRVYIDKALSALSHHHKSDPDSEFRLLLALASADYQTQSLRRGEATSTYKSVLELAKHYGDVGRQIQALYGTICTTVMAGQYNQAALLTKKMAKHVESYPAQEPLLHRLQALVDGQSGCFNQAIMHTRQALTVAPAYGQGPEHQDRTRYDHRATVMAIQARLLWLVGDADDALTVASASLERALEIDHKLSIGCSLALGACPVACWRGDIDSVVRFLQMLEAISHEFRLLNCRGEAQCYAYAVLGRHPFQDLSQKQVDLLSPASHELLATVSDGYLTPLAIERAKSGKAGWSTAEIFRAIGESLLRDDVKSRGDAERMFNAARRVSKRQGAFAWELRAATSLARSQYCRRQFNEAEELIGETLERVKQGHSTRDVMSAQSLLNDIVSRSKFVEANSPKFGGGHSS